MDRVKVRRVILFFRKLARRWNKHGHTDNAAALTFYGLISLPPLLLIGVTVAGMVLGEKAAHGELEKQLVSVVGDDIAQGIQGFIQNARVAPWANPGAFVIAMVTLLYAGSNVLSKLQTTLNVVNEAEPAVARRPWLAMIAERGVCAGLILLFGIVLAAGAILEGIIGYITAHVDAPWLADFGLLRQFGWVTTYLPLVLAFALVLKILPRRRPTWKHVIVGAAVAALAVVSLKSGLGLYFRHTMWSSFISNGLSFLLFVFWLFASIQAFLAGAEVTAWLGRRGTRRRRKLAGRPPSERAPAGE